MWSVDGLYFVKIEDKFGTEVATQIDKDVWKTMGKIEARRLRDPFDIEEEDIPSMMYGLRLSGWCLDLEDKEIEINEERAVRRNTSCRAQQTRLEKGLGEFPCKKVRQSYLEAFAEQFDPKIELKCNVCPPD